MRRDFLTSLTGAIALVLVGFGAGSLTIAPAYALHECGTPHEGKSEHSVGCNKLDEADFFYGDARPDAPELARRGSYAIGVRTLEAVNPDLTLEGLRVIANLNS